MTNITEEPQMENVDELLVADEGDADGQISFMVPGQEELPELDEQETKAAIEAILFTMGKAVEIDQLAEAVNKDKAELRKLLEEMQQEYQGASRGIMLLYLEDKVQLCTKQEYYQHLIRIASQPKKQVLTEVMLETLSIIAYKQPVTKIDIERIRGVKSDFGVNKLLEYGLIEEVGRLDAPGRPLLFATSEEFLRRFGMKSVENLPQIDAQIMEDIKEEAEGEIDVTV